MIDETQRDTLLERYRTALKMRWGQLESLILNLLPEPHWLEGEDAFWYQRQTVNGVELMVVNPAQGIVQPAFDHAKVAALLSKVLGKTLEPTTLPIEHFAYALVNGLPNHNLFRIEIEGQTWLCDVVARTCETASESFAALPKSSWPNGDIPGVLHGSSLPSPDGRLAAFVHDHNLYLRDTRSQRETRLTFDGSPQQSYAQLSSTPWSGEVSYPKNVGPFPPQVVWSPDSKKLAVVCVDMTQVSTYHLLESVPDGRYDVPPRLHSYPLSSARDAGPTMTLVIFDTTTGSRVEVDYEPVAAINAPLQVGRLVWSQDSQQLFFLDCLRGHRQVALVSIDRVTGTVRELVREVQEPYCNLNYVYESDLTFQLTPDGRELIWFSERSGWGHYYLYDVATGNLKNTITSGEWLVDRIHFVDAEKRVLYFTAQGRETGRDPYFRHLYRVNFDGSDLRLLTPEDADHDVAMSPSGTYFVDRYSRVDLPTVTIVRDNEGQHLLELERADLSKLQALNWHFPERFKALAADGKTEVYGLLCKPYDFDPNKRYPIVEWVYGPLNSRQAASSLPDFFAGSSVDLNALAQLGFIGMCLDGRGTPERDKTFQNYCFNEGFTDGGSLADHIAALKQLAVSRPYLDLERVGITGYSGGGYSSTRGVLKYPDVYKVAVSGAGSHNMWQVGGAIWGELFLGLPQENKELWQSQSNTALAHKLKGKLLLIQGEMDDDVHPANTLQVVDALIKAGKEFDLLIVPGRNHSSTIGPYYLRKLFDYFVRHLLHQEPPNWNHIPFSTVAEQT